MLYNAMKQAGYWCLNAESLESVYEYIEEDTPIRLARKGKVFPNIELQVAKSNLEQLVLDDPLLVEIAGIELNISAIEFQVLYKRLVLQSYQDLEDAEYLEIIFKDRLNKDRLANFKKLLENSGYYG